MTTIREVATLAEVSTATVSRVLNNNSNVKADTKKRVEDAIERLNYHPNDVARTLYKGQSKIIALLDRKSTRLNSSHVSISYAVFCLKKKKRKYIIYI